MKPMVVSEIIESPCLGCENRAPKCHSVCEVYKLYKQELASVKDTIRKEKQDTRLVRDYVNRRIDKISKRKNIRKGV